MKSCFKFNAWLTSPSSPRLSWAHSTARLWLPSRAKWTKWSWCSSWFKSRKRFKVDFSTDYEAATSFLNTVESNLKKNEQAELLLQLQKVKVWARRFSKSSIKTWRKAIHCWMKRGFSSTANAIGTNVFILSSTECGVNFILWKTTTRISTTKHSNSWPTRMKNNLSKMKRFNYRSRWPKPFSSVKRFITSANSYFL